MRTTTIRIIKYALLLLLCAVLWAVFRPGKYAIQPFEKMDQTRYWDLSTGSRIGYTFIPARGEKKSYPVIYLVGGPGGYISEGTIRDFTLLAEDGYDIYLYDQIGSGHSDRLADIEAYTVDRHKSDLAAIIQNISAEKVILIGQSWGAILATLFVADHPEKVNKLILTGPGPIFPVRQELVGMPSPDSLHLKSPLFSNRQGNDKVNNLRSQMVALWATVFGCKLASDREMDAFQTVLSNETNKSIVCDTARAPTPRAGGNGYFVQLMTMRSLSEVSDPRPQLDHSDIPLFIMRGQCDNQKWGFITEYLDLFPKHQLVIIPDAGHAISIEQPELYLRTLRGFLAE